MMKLQVVTIFLIFTVAAQAQSKSPATETGVVCVSAVPKPNSEPISLGNPDGGADRSTTQFRSVHEKSPLRQSAQLRLMAYR
jgi:hypothetical protein